MAGQGEIVNRVSKSSLIQLDMADFFPKEEIVGYDISQNLWQGFALKEKDFRDFIKNNDWPQFKGKHVALHCKADAIVPVWAYMLLTTSLKVHAQSVLFGNEKNVEQQLLIKTIEALNQADYIDARVVIKGCSDKEVSEGAWVAITNKLQPVVKTIMFGEPCSTVPVYKKPKV